MLVNDCMTRHPVMIPPNIGAAEAQQVMAENKVRHLPVVGDGKRLQGLITRQRLALKPDSIGSFNVWEITRYLSNVKVKQLMVPARDVVTITPERTVERAARVMMDHRIGCLPVLEDKIVVGMITEVDLMSSLQEMLGLPSSGVRVTMRMKDRKGEFSKLMTIIGEQAWDIMGIGTFPSHRHPGYYDMVLKIVHASAADIKATLSQVQDQELVDIREVS